MNLTPENYYSPEANFHYMSVSQYKRFRECEAASLAELRGEWTGKPNEALLVGQYIHTALLEPDRLEAFKAANPSMFSSRGATKGELKANFQEAEAMIQAVQNDALMMEIINRSEKEVIQTGIIGGHPWKCKKDLEGPAWNADLKSCRSIIEKEWVDGKGKVPFYEAYDYFLQAAIYDEVDKQNREHVVPIDFLLLAVSKEEPPDKAVLSLYDPGRFAEELAAVEEYTPRIAAIKRGEIIPARCGRCAYCRSTKQAKIQSFRELIG